MSIPDPTIDPVTGLPLLNPSDVVQQIPLGVQAFPWKDMGATALPTRGPLYGDDILPVSAFVAGQHPSTGSAQTVGTDGNHAMLVKDVSGGGGGGGLSKVVPHLLYGAGYQQSAGISFDQKATWLLADYPTLLGYQVSVWWICDGSGAGPPGWMQFGLTDNLGTSYKLFAGFPTVHQAVVMNNPVTTQSALMFPEPWDLLTLFPGATTIFADIANNPAAPVLFGWHLSVYLGPT